MSLLVLIGAYLLGAVPFGLIMARAWGGPDPRSGGSGNIGATNVARMAGKPAGVATLLLDVAKGALPCYLAQSWLPGDQSTWLAPAAGLAAFLGHCWPIYLKFKGGKGVATAMGVFLALAPAALPGILGVFLLAAWKTGHVSVGSIAGCSSAPMWMLITSQGWPLGFMSLAIALTVIWRHRENISRLRQGAEHGWH